MPQTITLQLPAVQPFRALAAEAAGRICALAGGDPAEAAAFGTQLAGALDALPADSETVDLLFETAPGSIEVRLTCGPRSQVLRRQWSNPVR